jgi:hypothetical protein
VRQQKQKLEEESRKQKEQGMPFKIYHMLVFDLEMLAKKEAQKLETDEKKRKGWQFLLLNMFLNVLTSK